MKEQSKAQERRKRDPRFTERWFVGKALDVGSGNDPLDVAVWPKLTEVVPYDKDSGGMDGQYLPEFGDNVFDVVHSSHCLEHIKATRSTLGNWLRVLKPGGFIVCTIPEELYYEYGKWPSRWNADHKVSFSLRRTPIIPMSVDLQQVLWKLPADLEHLTLLSSDWDISLAGQDQTMTGAECAIEFVVRKPDINKLW